MSDTGEAPRPARRPHPDVKLGRLPSWWLVRRVVGIALLVVVAIAAVLYILGSWNPWGLVFLEYRFGNPTVGLLLVPILAFVGFWLGLPVQNETRQSGRIAARWTSAAVAVVGLLVWGVFGDHFAFDAEEVARSESGERAAAIVTDRDTQPNSYVRIWAGSGLLTREVGDLGQVCGAVTVRFVTEDRLELDTSYGTWGFDLDPETGEPLQVLGSRCPDGPVPATMS